jgi:hypothetical protein
MNEHVVLIHTNKTSDKEKFLELIKLCTVDIPHTIDQSSDEYEDRIFIFFKSIYNARTFIHDFYFNISNRKDGVKINTHEFMMSSLDQILTNEILVSQQRSMMYDITLLDHIASDMSGDILKIKNGIAVLNEFIKTSGIIYYKEFMDQLLDVLDSKEILSKEFAKEKMFPTKH